MICKHFEEYKDGVIKLNKKLDKEKYNKRKYKNYKIIVGHTPVQTIVKDMTKILVLNNTFYIDCGAVFGGKLACLRLDDMKRFYV